MDPVIPALLLHKTARLTLFHRLQHLEQIRAVIREQTGDIDFKVFEIVREGLDEVTTQTQWRLVRVNEAPREVPYVRLPRGVPSIKKK